jgi:hypothetical protein
MVNKGILQSWGTGLFIVRGTGKDSVYTLGSLAMLFGKVLDLGVTILL